MRIGRPIAVGLVAAALLVVPAAGAAASCALDERPLEEQVAEAPIAFVGRVVDVRHDTTARFEVAEVWQGDVPAQVTVLGGPDEAGVATSVDRSWEVGTSYLVVPYVEGGELHDNSCTPTRPWSDDLADVRPADVRAPTPADPAGSGAPGPWVLALVGVLLVGAVVTTAVFARPRRDEG